MQRLLLFVLLLSFFQLQAQDTASIMFYNLLQFPNEQPERISELKSIIDATEPDVFMVCELSSNTGSVKILTQALNTSGRAYYQRGVFRNDGSLNNMLYYDSRKYQMLRQDTIDGWPRFATVYQLLHREALSVGDSLISTFIVVHLKAGNEDEDARNESALKIRRFVKNETNGENIFLAGDLNIYTHLEPAYKTLTKSGGPFNDPMNEEGVWNNTEYYAPIHTQSTRTTYFGGGSTGGLDDRFDFILTTSDILNGQNQIQYIQRSYEAYGNDGDHFNNAINFKENDEVSKELADALHDMSDHLPVRMQVVYDISNSLPKQATNFPEIRIRRVAGQIQINTDADLQSLEVINLQGKRCGFKNVSSRSVFFPIDNLQKNSVYILRLKVGGAIHYKKILL